MPASGSQWCHHFPPFHVHAAVWDASSPVISQLKSCTTTLPRFSFYHPVLWNQLAPASVVTGVGNLNLTFPDFTPNQFAKGVKHSPGDNDAELLLLLEPKSHRGRSSLDLSGRWICCVLMNVQMNPTDLRNASPPGFLQTRRVATWWEPLLMYWHIDIVHWHLSVFYIKVHVDITPGAQDPTPWGFESIFSICGRRMWLIPTLRGLGLAVADVQLHSLCIFLRNTGSNEVAPTVFS